jgi:hypothetical protein
MTNYRDMSEVKPIAANKTTTLSSQRFLTLLPHLLEGLPKLLADCINSNT